MCNLSQGILEKGMKKGMEKGMEKGIEKGKAEGILTAIKNLMTNTGWPMEKAMETLGVSEAERSKYASLLQKQ